jgi:hypothetical protein
MLLWVVEYGHPGSICVALVGTMSVSEIVALARLLLNCTPHWYLLIVVVTNYLPFEGS